MFTGLIEDVGTLLRIDKTASGARLTLQTALPTSDIKLGDSISCNGVCLTATRVEPGLFTADLSGETLTRSSFAQARAGSKINLERALRLGDRLGGHIVAGHVDGVGRIARVQRSQDAIYIDVTCPADLRKYTIEKGSIAVDGISLTINSLTPEGFGLALIPHSQEKTTLSTRSVGDTVNLEVDLVGKYVESLLGSHAGSDSALTKKKLAELGFLRG